MHEDLRDLVSGLCRLASPEDVLANDNFKDGRTFVVSTNEHRNEGVLSE